MIHRDFIDFFIKIKQLSLADLTILSYRSCLERYLDLDAEISDMDLFKAQNIMFCMKNLSEATQRRNLTILSQYYKYAVKYGYIASNPFQDVERPRKTHLDDLSNKVYSEDELKLLLNALADEPLIWRLYVFFALDTGCRRGEMVAMKWCDLDFAKGYLQISHTAYKLHGANTQLKEPKSRRCRGLIISHVTLKLLSVHKLAQKEYALCIGVPFSESNYIFGFGCGNRIMHPSTPSRWWRRFLKRRRLPVYRLHDLRHTSATLLLRNGVDVRTVCRRLGHASLSTTMLYLEPNNEQYVSEIMNGIMTKAVSL